MCVLCTLCVCECAHNSQYVTMYYKRGDIKKSDVMCALTSSDERNSGNR